MAANTHVSPKLRGYPKLAAYMGAHSETAIFRRFNHLNMLNLLSLQSELMDLEVHLQNIRTEDETSDDPLRMLHAVDFYEMRQSKRDGNGLQWQIMLDIRRKLQEYSTAVSLHTYNMQTVAECIARRSTPPSLPSG